MPRSVGKDIAEIFGHAPDDLTEPARSLWSSYACPFVGGTCTKTNHDKSIVYGVCSVQNNDGNEVIVCPKRLYANDYEVIKKVSEAVFGRDIDCFTFDGFAQQKQKKGLAVVALGQGSGHEVGLGRTLSIDWVLALLEDESLIDYAGLEIQTMDITGNYRENWRSYKELPKYNNSNIVESEHGINWANVHKRLIPQLIRKGSVFKKSSVCKKGLHFVLPEVVYQKFEDVIGSMKQCVHLGNDVLSVHTYELGDNVPHGQIRQLVHKRSERFKLDDFAAGFISGPNLPDGDYLDDAIRKALDSHL